MGRGARGIPPTLGLAMETIEAKGRSKAAFLGPIDGSPPQGKRITKKRVNTIIDEMSPA